jgi:hypothetical protein
MSYTRNNNKSNQNGSGNGGCFGIVVLLILPVAGAGYYIIKV